jgi:hypothetical protein
MQPDRHAVVDQEIMAIRCQFSDKHLTVLDMYHGAPGWQDCSMVALAYGVVVVPTAETPKFKYLNNLY